MNRHLRAGLVLALGFSAAAPSCRGRSDEPEDMSPASVCAFYAERDCAIFERCYPSGITKSYNDVATCRDRIARSCELRLTATGTNETADRVMACAEALASLACDTFFDRNRWPESCSLRQGKLADGAGCVAAGQCQGRHCLFWQGERCGQCTTVSPAGAACMSHFECLNGMPCVNGVCTLHSSLGEPCDGERWCVTGLICKTGDTSDAGTCEKLLPAGLACDPHSRDGDACDNTKGLACNEGTRTCGPPTYGLGEIGARCAIPSECAAVSYCNPQGVCQARPREGERCLAGESDCLGPARCYQGTCVSRDPAVCQ
jgi:hypothetical protein